MDFLLTFLLLITAFPWSNYAYINFEDRSVDHWELLIGANSKGLKYDFCKFNSTSQGRQCKSFQNDASIVIGKVCNCSVQHNETEAGAFTFSVNCNSNSSWCPENLDLKYQQGFIEKPSESADAEGISATTICLGLSLLANFILIIVVGVLLVKYRGQVQSEL